VTIPTGIAGVDGREQKLTEHLCDHPGCPNIAVHVVGVARELSLALALCAEHTALSRRRRRDDVQT
jgi:hypothetical protein